jgi:3-deoxy-7-phosphoheptulonate synthase
MSSKSFIFIAGPCAAENSAQIMQTAKALSKIGVPIMRAGIWKPRTNPNDWQGAGDIALDWMTEAKKKTGILTATEVKDSRTIELAIKAGIDYLWIGSRNAQNYALLEEVGRATAENKTPVILKRSMSSSLAEWLGGAGYVAKYNPNVILCERGIRGYSPDTRNILDLQTAYLAKLQSNYKVIVDVSHAAGRTDLIFPMSMAVKASGLDGLMIEAHPDPKNAKTDSFQQIDFKEIKKIFNAVKN